MFSRVGRLTTFGAHAISNCPFRRDKNCQPQWAVATTSNGFASFSHTFSDSLKTHSSNFECDPFLGVTSDEEKRVIQELELLDLDKWNATNDDKNIITVCGRSNLKTTSSTIQSLQNESDSDHLPNWLDNFSPKPLETSPQKIEFDVDSASKMVDWDAWNKYLNSDEAVNNDISKAFVRPENQTNDEVVKLEVKQEIVEKEEVKPQPVKRWEPYDTSLFTSGPIHWSPNETSKPRKTRVKRTYDEDDDWSEASFDSKKKPKKRGVVMKPSVDDETDRRRALNRVAALRYREKKRVEQEFRKRELQEVVDRNCLLKKQERHLKKEIKKMRLKLKNAGHDL